MTRWVVPGVFGAGCLGLLALAVSGSRLPEAERSRTPVLVELFTSEGCLSCPPADELLIRLDTEQPVPGALVVSLGEHVDYWNGQWQDPFSSTAFTDRQREYQRVLATPALYTPQMVVDGQVQLIGSRQQLAHEAIARASKRPKATVSLPRLDLTWNEVSVDITVSGMAGLEPVHDVDLWIAIAEEGLQTDVTRGENAFRHLRHGAVVRALHPVETLTLPVPDHIRAEAVMEIDPEWHTECLKVVSFLQERSSRRVLGVTQRRLRSRY